MLLDHLAKVERHIREGERDTFCVNAR